MAGPAQDPHMLEAHPVEAFSDNYIWLLEASGGAAVVVDPGDARPVLDALAERRLALGGILVTHHHADHVGGIEALLEACGEVPVYGPRNSPATCISRRLDDGDRIEVLGFGAQVITVPGHTLDHIAYLFADTGGGAPALFCGDTLFAGGCGRVFEGTPAIMHDSLARLAALDPATRVYCAHEYTLSNLRFAVAVEPGSASLRQRLAEDAARRERGEPTVPSTIGRELATNPFLRSSVPEVKEAAIRQAGRELREDHEVFAMIRSWKDTFR